MDCAPDCVGITAGVPQLADDFAASPKSALAEHCSLSAHT